MTKPHPLKGKKAKPPVVAAPVVAKGVIFDKKALNGGMPLPMPRPAGTPPADWKPVLEAQPKPTKAKKRHIPVDVIVALFVVALVLFGLFKFASYIVKLDDLGWSCKHQCIAKGFPEGGRYESEVCQCHKGYQDFPFDITFVPPPKPGGKSPK